MLGGVVDVREDDAAEEKGGLGAGEKREGLAHLTLDRHLAYHRLRTRDNQRTRTPDDHRDVNIQSGTTEREHE